MNKISVIEVTKGKLVLSSARNCVFELPSGNTVKCVCCYSNRSDIKWLRKPGCLLQAVTRFVQPSWSAMDALDSAVCPRRCLGATRLDARCRLVTTCMVSALRNWSNTEML